MLQIHADTPYSCYRTIFFTFHRVPLIQQESSVWQSRNFWSFAGSPTLPTPATWAVSKHRFICLFFSSIVSHLLLTFRLNFLIIVILVFWSTEMYHQLVGRLAPSLWCCAAGEAEKAWRQLMVMVEGGRKPIPIHSPVAAIAGDCNAFCLRSCFNEFVLWLVVYLLIAF